MDDVWVVRALDASQARCQARPRDSRDRVKEDRTTFRPPVGDGISPGQRGFETPSSGPSPGLSPASAQLLRVSPTGVPTLSTPPVDEWLSEGLDGAYGTQARPRSRQVRKVVSAGL